ncbi:MAG: FAD-dependent monooxygenase [Vicinamibacteria bacterium]|nr:FAD-dependent monooxygenase [Vicinamibacteria bacterium]
MTQRPLLTLATGDPLTVDVLIVGAGPTGLALASMLQRSGISMLLADKLEAGLNTSRAAVIHAHTLDVLETLGVSGRLAERGLTLYRFSLWDRDSALLRLRFDSLPSKHSGLLMLPQDVTEALLAETLAEAGGRVERGVTVDSLSETPRGVTASLVSSEGRRTVHARFVVGGDGMHSLVRQTAGIGFSGTSYEESFVLADVEMEWGKGRGEVTLFFSPAGLVVVAPLPSGAYRVVATLERAPERPGVADIQALLDARGPSRDGGRVSAVHWSSRFRLHHRVADRYRRGPFFLMGDAAHVHSPAGGQGMNTGLVDACVLGQILADVLSGRREEGHLDKYETLRRPAAQQVLGLTGRLTHMAVMKGAPRRLVRNAALRTLNLIPAARRRIEMNLSGLSREAAARIA